MGSCAGIAVRAPRRSGPRARRALAALAALSTACLAGCTGAGSGAGLVDPTSGTAVRTYPAVNLGGALHTNGRGPQLPDRGYWAGAWQAGGQSGSIESVLKKPLDVVHSFHPWQEPFPTEAERASVASGRLLMLSWAGTDTRTLASGAGDDLIRQRAAALRDLGAPVLLRFRWEMDRPNLRDVVHSPQDYIAAWRHARQIFDAAGANNVAWVWCPLATGFIEKRAADYYPGDDQVDWLCADAYPGRKDSLEAASLLTPFLSWAASHPRPIIIGEFAAQRGDPGWRAGFLSDFRSIVAATPQVKALTYYWARKDGKPLFDSTFDGEPDAAAAFRDLMEAPALRAPAPVLAVKP